MCTQSVGDSSRDVSGSTGLEFITVERTCKSYLFHLLVDTVGVKLTHLVLNQLLAGQHYYGNTLDESTSVVPVEHLPHPATEQSVDLRRDQPSQSADSVSGKR